MPEASWEGANHMPYCKQSVPDGAFVLLTSEGIWNYDTETTSWRGQSVFRNGLTSREVEGQKRGLWLL